MYVKCMHMYARKKLQKYKCQKIVQKEILPQVIFSINNVEDI